MTHWEWRELKTTLQLSAFPLHLCILVCQQAQLTVPLWATWMMTTWQFHLACKSIKCLRVLVRWPSTYQVTFLKQSTTPCWFISALAVGGLPYQSGVYNVTVVVKQTSAEVFIAIFDDSIVKENETFTAVLSVPVTESALGVSVSATNGTAYVEILDNGKQSPLHMHLIVCWPFISHCLLSLRLVLHSVRCPTRWLKAVAMSW